MLEIFLWIIVAVIWYHLALFIWRLFVLLCSLVYDLYKFAVSMFHRKGTL